MRHWRFLLFLFFIPASVRAGDTLSDKKQVLLLDSLSWELQPSDIDSALVLAGEAYRGAVSLNDTALLLQTLRTIGSACVRKGFYERGVDYYMKAKIIGERQDNNNVLAKIYTGLAVIYKRTEKYDLALQYNRKALKSDLETGDSSGIAADYNNIGVVLRYLKRPQEALNYFADAVALRSRLGEKKKLPGTYSNMANAYCDLGKHEEAVSIYRKALQNRDPVPSDDLLMANLANCMIHLGQPEKAKLALDTALALAHENNSLYALGIVHQFLAEVYEKTGDTRKALENFKLFRMYEDSLKKEDAGSRLAELQEQYESARKDRDLAELGQKNLSLQLEQTRITRLAWITGLSAAVILLLVLFLFQRRSRIQKAKQHAALIREKERGLKVTLEAVEAERSRMARDLHDGIAQQLAALKLSWQKLTGDVKSGKAVATEMESTLDILDAAGKEVRTMSHTIMPPALKHHGLGAALSDLVQKSFSAGTIRSSFDDFTGQAVIPENTAIHVYRIAQEMISNIIRHSGASHTQVQVLVREGRLILRMEDNGKGFNFAAAGGGIGLTNISNRVAILGGELRCESGQGKGTAFIVRLPL
ncbi:MAG: signal transduction histidine kinase [Bacteroidetes bacterium]|nr:MAG: signal transduction histidine kinase [Bacteroidota bacterium]